MATISKFEDLEAWKKARTFAQDIYALIRSGAFGNDIELINQINRSSGSIMDNTAEGFERGGKNEFVHFLSIAKGSAGEARSQLYRALDRKHINQDEFDKLYRQVVDISKIINGLMNYLNKSEHKGTKYKNRTV